MDAGLMDLDKDQRLGYLHNYESAYAPKFQNSNEQQLLDKEAYLDYEAGHPGEEFLELDYDRLNAAGLLLDDRDDFYERNLQATMHERYMLPTEEQQQQQQQQQQQSSMFNPQFLPNFNDMMRLVASYEGSEHSKFYPNESDEYQEIVGENERLAAAYRQSSGTSNTQQQQRHHLGFPNRSSLELNRVERDNFGPPKTQTTGRRSGSTGKPKFNARIDPSNFLS